MPNCVNCGAAMRMDGNLGILVCDHCGSQQQLPAFIEYVDLLTETEFPCPVCSTPLSTAWLEGRPLLCCGHCFGMLIEMNRFVEVIDAVRAHEIQSGQTLLPRRQNPDDRVINCPKCGNPMLAHIYAGPGNVVIDTCERCQVNWLDPGELRRVALAPGWNA